MRELENAMERAAALATGPRITLADLPPTLTDEAPTGTHHDRERAAIVAALADHPSRHAAAAALGISVSTLYRRRRRHGL